MLFDLDEGSLSKEEIEIARRGARKLLWLSTKRALYATAAFSLSCASVVPFLEGFPLHARWQSFGKYLVLLSMGLLIPFVMCAGIAINYWFYVRGLEKLNS